MMSALGSNVWVGHEDIAEEKCYIRLQFFTKFDVHSTSKDDNNTWFIFFSLSSHDPSQQVKEPCEDFEGASRPYKLLEL